ncbi:MAG: hypothetical protein ACRD47_11825, partial [Nitrososphaeraceae archaeon]
MVDISFLYRSMVCFPFAVKKVKHIIPLKSMKSRLFRNHLYLEDKSSATAWFHWMMLIPFNVT